MWTEKAVKGTNESQHQQRRQHVLRAKSDILHITDVDLWPMQQLAQADQWLQLGLRQAYNTSTQALSTRTNEQPFYGTLIQDNPGEPVLSQGQDLLKACMT